MSVDRVGGGGDRIEDDRVDGWLGRVLALWVDGAQRHARAVLVATALITAALLAYAVTHLGVNASHKALLSDDLPFWREYMAFSKVFPILDEALIVVVDAETSGQVRDASRALAARLAEQSELFPSVYTPGGGAFFERNALLYLSVEELEELSDRMATVQPLLAELARERSLPRLVQVLEQGMELSRSDSSVDFDLNAVFDSVSLAAQTILDNHPRPISWAELLLRRSFPADSSRRVIILEPRLDYETLLPARIPIAAVREAARELGLTPERGVKVRITGNLALNYEEMLVIARQVAWAAVGSFVLVGAILTMALGSRRLIGATLVSLLVGLIWTGAFAAWAVGHVNLVSVAFAVLFIGLGVDFGIHMVMHYAELVRGGTSHRDALDDTARSVGPSLALCALTTAIGFMVFLPTDFRAVGELGLISGVGMPISLLCNLTVLPAMLSVGGPVRLGPERRLPARLMQSLFPAALHHAGRVRAVAAVLALGALAALPSAQFDHNVVRMRDPSTESVKTFDDLLGDSHTSPWTIDILARDLAEAERLAARLRDRPFVERAITLRDYVPADQEAKQELLADLAYFVPEPPDEEGRTRSFDVDEQLAAVRTLRDILREPWLTTGDTTRRDSVWRAEGSLDRLLARLETLERKRDMLEDFERSLLGSLPDQLERLWGALEPDQVELETLPAELVERMLAADGRARIEVLPREDLGENAALVAFVDGVREAAPQATGSAVAVLEWARAVVRSFQQALTGAFVAVALVVWLLWRRGRDLLLVLAPLVLAAVLTGAAAVILGIRFNFANVLVLPLLLGVGVDSGIHLVHRHRVLEAGAAAGSAGRVLLGSSTAQAVFFSALTTMGSFGSLVFATHRGFSSLGQLLLIGVTLTLACNLLVLPALIAGTSKRG